MVKILVKHYKRISMQARNTPNVSFRRNIIKVLISQELKTILAERKFAID